jgi:hypothetical protein
MKRNIMEMVKGKQVKFLFYRKGELMYTTECGFQFAVPVSDTGDAEFKPEDKASLFMRWLRPALKEAEKQENANPC